MKPTTKYKHINGKKSVFYTRRAAYWVRRMLSIKDEFFPTKEAFKSFINDAKSLTGMSQKIYKSSASTQVAIGIAKAYGSDIYKLSKSASNSAYRIDAITDEYLERFFNFFISDDFTQKEIKIRLNDSTTANMTAGQQLMLATYYVLTHADTCASEVDYTYEAFKLHKHSTCNKKHFKKTAKNIILKDEDSTPTVNVVEQSFISLPKGKQKIVHKTIVDKTPNTDAPMMDEIQSYYAMKASSENDIEENTESNVMDKASKDEYINALVHNINSSISIVKSADRNVYKLMQSVSVYYLINHNVNREKIGTLTDDLKSCLDKLIGKTYLIDYLIGVAKLA